MSHNLRIRDSDTQPWQTPTWVTDICLSLSNRTGRPDGGQRAVLRRYRCWVRSHADGVYHTQAAADAQHELVDAHMAEIRRCVEHLGDRLEFYST